jgi:hypothetical protein
MERSRQKDFVQKTETSDVELGGYSDPQQILKKLALERMSRSTIHVSEPNPAQAIAFKAEPEPEKSISSPI